MRYGMKYARVLALPTIGAAPPHAVDVAIRGGTTYTSADSPSMTGDIEISGDRIVYVGLARSTPALRVIDARGEIDAPGFIDAHTHPDRYFRLTDPAARLNLPWLAQGASTVVIGVDSRGTPDIAKDAHAFEASGIGTNIVPFVGFGAIRILSAPNAAGDGPRGTGIASYNMADRDVGLIVKQPWVVTSSDGSNGHPRQYATFPSKYQVYVRQRHVIDTRAFIRRSTWLTADIYKIRDRGYLKSSYYADGVVFDPVVCEPRADYVHPKLPTVGVTALFVNGRLALANGKPTGEAAGRALLRAKPANCPAS